MYNDEKSYQFDENDTADRCFACGQNSESLLVVRHIRGMQLVHLCRNCMLENIADYFLDNTKPWSPTPGEK